MHRPGPDTIEADTPLLKQSVNSDGKEETHYGTKNGGQTLSKDDFPMGIYGRHSVWPSSH